MAATDGGESRYWAEPLDDLLRRLRSAAHGISSRDAVDRLRREEPNVLSATPRAGIVRLFLRQFSNPLVAILVVAAIVSALLGEATDSGIIVVVSEMPSAASR